MTEQDYLDLAWRAHVGGLADRMNLTMARLKLKGGWNDRIVLVFEGMADAMLAYSRSIRDMPVFLPQGLYDAAEDMGVIMDRYEVTPKIADYTDIEERVIAMCAKPHREDLPCYFLDPRKLDYTPHTYDYKRHNKTATGRLRNYRGPPPQRFK